VSWREYYVFFVLNNSANGADGLFNQPVVNTIHMEDVEASQPAHSICWLKLFDADHALLLSFLLAFLLLCLFRF